MTWHNCKRCGCLTRKWLCRQCGQAQAYYLAIVLTGVLLGVLLAVFL